MPVTAALIEGAELGMDARGDRFYALRVLDPVRPAIGPATYLLPGTVKTGTGDRRTSVSATLPSRRCLSPVRP